MTRGETQFYRDTPVCRLLLGLLVLVLLLLLLAFRVQQHFQQHHTWFILLLPLLLLFSPSHLLQLLPVHSCKLQAWSRAGVACLSRSLIAVSAGWRGARLSKQWRL